MAKEVQKLCGATLPNSNGLDFECEKEEGHKGKHGSRAGGWWTDGGAERLREERRKQIEAEPF